MNIYILFLMHGKESIIFEIKFKNWNAYNALPGSSPLQVGEERKSLRLLTK